MSDRKVMDVGVLSTNNSDLACFALRRIGTIVVRIGVSMGAVFSQENYGRALGMNVI